MKKHHTKTKGDLGVLKVQCDLAEKEYAILIPLTEHAPFDIVAYKDGKFKRIQVKYRRMVNGRVMVPFQSSWADVNGSHSVDMDKSQVDIVAIYCPDTNKCYYVNPRDFGRCISLRVSPSKNNQSMGINFSENYLEIP